MQRESPVSTGPSTSDSYVDGNALAGALTMAFGRDMTSATAECQACGHSHAMAEAMVYLRCPGMVMRCPSCTHAEAVLVEIGHRMQLTVTGLRQIAFA